VIFADDLRLCRRRARHAAEIRRDAAVEAFGNALALTALKQQTFIVHTSSCLIRRLKTAPSIGACLPNCRMALPSRLEVRYTELPKQEAPGIRLRFLIAFLRAGAVTTFVIDTQQHRTAACASRL